MEREPLWPKIIGYVLWAVSAVFGLGTLFAAIGTVEALVPRMFLRCDPMQTVACSGQARTLMLVSYAVLGIIWLVWYIVLVETYTRAKSPELVAKRFAITTGIQLAIVFVWLLITRVVLA